MPTELFSPLMTAREARLKTPLALAYVGDTVWDLLVRRSLISQERLGVRGEGGDWELAHNLTEF